MACSYIVSSTLEPKGQSRVVFGMLVLQRFFKWWPWVDRDRLYGKVKFCFLMHFNGKVRFFKLHAVNQTNLSTPYNQSINQIIYSYTYKQSIKLSSTAKYSIKLRIYYQRGGWSVLKFWYMLLHVIGPSIYGFILPWNEATGPRSAVGNASVYRCVSDCRSRGRKFDPGPVPYFRGDWSWNNFYGHSPPFRWFIQEGLLSVTSESMCTKYWLTACSSLPRKKCG